MSRTAVRWHRSTNNIIHAFVFSDALPKPAPLCGKHLLIRDVVLDEVAPLELGAAGVKVCVDCFNAMAHLKVSQRESPWPMVVFFVTCAVLFLVAVYVVCL